MQYSIVGLKVKVGGLIGKPTATLHLALLTVQLLRGPPCCTNTFVHGLYCWVDGAGSCSVT